MFDAFDIVVLALGAGGALVLRDLFRVVALALLFRGVKSGPEESRDDERRTSALNDRVRARLREHQEGGSSG